MPLPVANLRFPHERVLLPRTKLAYVHLRNLLTDAKRDRAARVYGYVAIWLPDAFALLYMQEGELVNATLTSDGRSYHASSIADALGRVPTEPELGEICFHEAEDEQLACMHASQLTPPDEWPAELDPRDAKAVFPYLMAMTFDGMLEVVANGAVNYLVFRNGSVVHAYLADQQLGAIPDRVRRLFAGADGPASIRVRRWPVPPPLPAQAPPALIGTYRELVAALVRRLVGSGSEGAPAIAEHARQLLLERHPELKGFGLSARMHKDPIASTAELTTAVAAWVAEILWASAHDGVSSPEDVLRELTRERRHVLQSAGFYDRLPWRVEW